MTRAERCTRTCMSVLQPTFECLTLSLYFIRDSSSPRGVHRCESSFQECGIDGRTTGEAHALKHKENETSNLRRALDLRHEEWAKKRTIINRPLQVAGSFSLCQCMRLTCRAGRQFRTLETKIRTDGRRAGLA